MARNSVGTHLPNEDSVSGSSSRSSLRGVRRLRPNPSKSDSGQPEDYRRIYAEEPDNPGVLALSIDTNATHSIAESVVGPLAFTT